MAQMIQRIYDLQFAIVWKSGFAICNLFIGISASRITFSAFRFMDIY